MKIIEIAEYSDETIGRPQIYTTGAFISPRKIVTNGNPYWVWVVDAFEGGDSFDDDGEVFNPLESATTKAGLFAEIEDDYEIE